MAMEPLLSAGGKTCTTCPSFLADQQQRQTMGGNVSGPICAIKMLPLIAPHQPRDTQKRVFASVAGDCDQYGREVKITAMPQTYAPILPVGMDSRAISIEPEADQSNARCSDCTHFVASHEVHNNTGWTAALCRASGNLMLDTKLPFYAKGCGQFKYHYGPRPKSGNLDTFVFLPQFSPTFGKVDLVAAYAKMSAKDLDPASHPTDRPVKDSDAQRGIISWRKIVDPEGYGAPTYLPVYNIKAFPDDLRVLVPQTGDDEHPELYADHGNLLYTMAVVWRELDETPAWWGQGGVGKTEFARHLAWLMQLPFNRLNITGSTDIDDLVGKMRFEQNETVFQYGRLPKAWKEPGVILFDEPNTGTAEIWQVVRPLTDNSRMLVLDQNRGERIPRGPDTYFTMAMNPAWDPRNIGTQTIGDADGSRLMHMFFSLPPQELEVAIIQKRVALDGWQLSSSQVRALMGVANDLRAASESGSLHTTWGIRHQIKVARALKWWTPVVAYRRAVADSLEPSQMEFLLGAVTSHFPDTSAVF